MSVEQGYHINLTTNQILLNENKNEKHKTKPQDHCCQIEQFEVQDHDGYQES